MTTQQIHQPVLLKAVLDTLQPKAGEAYLDLTAGYGGHAQAVLELTKTPEAMTLVDRDQFAINYLQGAMPKGVNLWHQDYLSAVRSFSEKGAQFDMILLDLGVSSPQLDNPERGFSFNKDAKLDMRMNQNDEFDASDLVNKASRRQLEQIIQAYGEETRSRAQAIAQLIVDNRPLNSTLELASLIEAKFGRHGRTHPATKTFQALRIEVNQELVQLEQSLPILPKLLKPGGRLAIISFHSLEDRLVKQFLKQEIKQGLAGQFRSISKPISGKTEQAFNPRSRSAILRGACKK